MTRQTYHTPDTSPFILRVGSNGEGIIMNGNHRRAAIKELPEPERTERRRQRAIVLHRDTPDDVVHRIIAGRSGDVERTITYAIREECWRV